MTKQTESEREAREIGNALSGCGAIIAAIVLAVVACGVVSWLAGY